MTEVDRLAVILGGVSLSEFESVARSIFADPTVMLIGQPGWRTIDAVHNDRRTLGLAKVTGRAKTQNGILDWSCVIKVIDPSLGANVAAAWVNVDIEEQVYELGLMVDEHLPFRPAKCFRTDRIDDGIKLFWLEDLSDAPHPPWSLDLYLTAARHVGEFNGQLALNPPELPFDLPVDVHRVRRNAGANLENVTSFYENRTDPIIMKALDGVPPESVVELSELWGKLHEVSPALPHGVVFGDCHARNLFPFKNETVAVDWAGLAFDPIGADVSVLIGSGLTWGIDEALMIVENERLIFDSYLSGLEAAGWSGDLLDVRRAFFTHFPLYLGFSAILPEWIRSGQIEVRRDFAEARYGATLEELPGRMPPITARIPGYVDELRGLLA